jgi:cell wall-associated NlpC family hydrolase
MSPELSKAFSKYVVVPYQNLGRTTSGWDCYGLYVCLLAERHGKHAPMHSDAYRSSEDERAVIAAIRSDRRLAWQRIERGTEQEGDGIVFNLAGQPLHCGYIIEPGMMIHAMIGRGTCIERYDVPAWEKRIEGIYRWN